MNGLFIIYNNGMKKIHHSIQYMVTNHETIYTLYLSMEMMKDAILHTFAIPEEDT
jgi:hypothetical protein